MGSKYYAKKRAKIKSRQVYRQNKRKSKRSVLKKFANFVGKVTYMKAKKSKKRRGRRMKYRRGRRMRFRRRRY